MGTRLKKLTAKTSTAACMEWTGNEAISIE